jgi:hypothetical protein
MVAVPPIQMVVSIDTFKNTGGGDAMLIVVSTAHPLASCAVMVFVPAHIPLNVETGENAAPLRLYCVAVADATVTDPSQDPLQVSSTVTTLEKVTDGGLIISHANVSTEHPLSSWTFKS